MPSRSSIFKILAFICSSWQFLGGTSFSLCGWDHLFHHLPPLEGYFLHCGKVSLFLGVLVPPSLGTIFATWPNPPSYPPSLSHGTSFSPSRVSSSLCGWFFLLRGWVSPSVGGRRLGPSLILPPTELLLSPTNPSPAVPNQHWCNERKSRNNHLIKANNSITQECKNKFGAVVVNYQNTLFDQALGFGDDQFFMFFQWFSHFEEWLYAMVYGAEEPLEKLSVCDGLELNTEHRYIYLFWSLLFNCELQHLHLLCNTSPTGKSKAPQKFSFQE